MTFLDIFFLNSINFCHQIDFEITILALFETPSLLVGFFLRLFLGGMLILGPPSLKFHERTDITTHMCYPAATMQARVSAQCRRASSFGMTNQSICASHENWENLFLFCSFKSVDTIQLSLQPTIR